MPLLQALGYGEVGCGCVQQSAVGPGKPLLCTERGVLLQALGDGEVGCGPTERAQRAAQSAVGLGKGRYGLASRIAVGGGKEGDEHHEHEIVSVCAAAGNRLSLKGWGVKKSPTLECPYF